MAFYKWAEVPCSLLLCLCTHMGEVGLAGVGMMHVVAAEWVHRMVKLNG